MTLQEWLDFAPQLDAIYQQELGRSCFSDPQAFVNWCCHWRENSQSLDWIRARIQESDEWKQKHGSPLPTPVPVPPPSGPLSTALTFTTGLVEHYSSTVVRPQVFTLLNLPTRGPFQFPAPYNVRGIRVTNGLDGTIRPVGYSYWPNASVAGDKVLVFCATVDNRLLRFEVDRASGTVTPLGAVGGLTTTAEGYYFTPYWPTKIMAPMGQRLCRIDFYTGAVETLFEAPFNIWQVSSSDDGMVHAGTLRTLDGWEDCGYFVWAEKQLRQFPLPDGYDECQLDKSGRWLVVKQGVTPNGGTGVDTYVQSVRDPSVNYTIDDRDGAVGHSDTGNGVVIGEDDQHEPGALVRFILGSGVERQLLYALTQWTTGLGHVAVRGPRILVSNASRVNAPRVNELVLVDPSGSGKARIVCPNLMDLDTGDQSDYEKQVKANIDPSGQYACWSANPGTLGMDIFLVELP